MKKIITPALSAIVLVSLFIGIYVPIPLSVKAQDRFPSSVQSSGIEHDSSSEIARLDRGEKIKHTKETIQQMISYPQEEVSDQFVVTILKDNLTTEDIESFTKQKRSSIPSHQKTIRTSVGKGQYVAMSIPDDTTLEDFLTELNNDEQVLFVEPAYKRELFWIPNDPNFSQQWQLQNIGGGITGIEMPKAWDYVDSVLDGILGPGNNCGGRSSVVVAVLDTGLAINNRTVDQIDPPESPGSYEHGWLFESNDELPVNIWTNPGEVLDGTDTDGNGYRDDLRGVNIDDRYTYPYLYDGLRTSEEGSPDDDYGHGTHVSLTIAGATNNNIAGSGIAFNTTIMPVKIFDHNGEIWSYSVVDGLAYAINHGAHIINMSFGGPSPSTVEEALINQAVAMNIIPVAASGNNGNTIVQYPAGYSNVIGVGASNPNGTRSSYSSYGSWIDLVAPVGTSSSGSGFYQYNYACYLSATQSNPLPCTNDNTSTWDPTTNSFLKINMTFGPSMGTSFATPQVSAVVGLLKSLNPNMTFNEVRYKLQMGATPKWSPWINDQVGYGVLNANETVRGQSLSTTQTVYRFWSRVYNGHFYTASTSERDHVIATWPTVWTYEGEVYKVPASCSYGAKPVYRFWSRKFNGHFYTISTTERDHVINSYDDRTWLYEGAVFCAYDSALPFTKPLYRFWSSRFGHHFYTASEAERDIVINTYNDWTWLYEGIGFRVSAY